MQIRTYTERSNARRAARAAGLDPESAIIETDDGFEVRFAPRQQHEPSPIKQAVEAAIERGLSPQQFVAEAEKVADALDAIPAFCKIPQERRREAWEKNPPKVTAAQPKESITMAKAKTKKPKAQTGDKTATLLKMLQGKGSTVEQLTEALEWLPHTLRARISRLPKDDKKIKVARERVGGVTTYRLA
jgi:hypothetical protein